jgi:hypothetical protein
MMVFQKGQQKWRQSGVLQLSQLKQVMNGFL